MFREAKAVSLWYLALWLGHAGRDDVRDSICAFSNVNNSSEGMDCLSYTITYDTEAVTSQHYVRYKDVWTGHALDGSKNFAGSFFLV